MRLSLRLLTLSAVLFLPGVSIAGERFDGRWLTTLTCEPLQDALGFSWNFVSEVKDGHLLGIYGTEGQPASIRIDGHIAEDGSATLHAAGKTGYKQYVPGQQMARGTDFGYDISAQFHDRDGKGTRLEGRPCSYTFKRQ